MNRSAKSRAPEGSRGPPVSSSTDSVHRQVDKTTTTTASKSVHGELPSINVPQVTTNVDGMAKRALDGQFRVNPANGTLSLAVPIWTTPGRSGMQPQLELAYDSGGGNGICGVGWQLGLPQVSRKTMKQLPRYDSSDVFVASGFDDLVQSQEPGHSFKVKKAYGKPSWFVDRYRPRIDTDSTRIELWTEEADVKNQFWCIVSPDNIARIYGFSEAARIQGEVGGHLQTFTWLLETTYDGTGNAIQHCYATADGRPYLKAVKYGNRHPSRNLSTWQFQPIPSSEWLYEVVLDYGEHSETFPTTQLSQPAPCRADCFSTFSAGFEIRTSRLCRRFLVFHHMPEFLHEQDYLVGSTNLLYEERPDGTVLTGIHAVGYTLNTSGEYHTERMPPLSFNYSPMCNWDQVEVQTYDTSSLQGIPGQQCPQIQWVDLNGDGSPGLLYEMKQGAWFYQRNENIGRLEEDGQTNDCSGFGGVQMLETKPVGEGEHYFADLQGIGQLDAVSVSVKGRMEGFFPRRRDSGWGEFQPFLSMPQEFGNDTTGSPHFIRIDLTGNGLADLMWINEFAAELIWYECRGTEGFGPATRVPLEINGPTLYRDDVLSKTFFCDMSGDGLTDIVIVRADQVSYWPNLGYGRFGTQVVMNNTPNLGQDGVSLVSERIYLADITGTGTADLLYLPPDGGLFVYQNLWGNSWNEDPSKLPSFPAINQMSTVMTVDLLGNGTTCLCWTGPGSDQTLDLRYIDPTSGLKPNLLASYSNGSGHVASVKYRPSTWYSLKDERQGNPWSSNLPFPVQCVDKVVQSDIPGGRSTTTCYRYHDGFYDSVEREFRGFAMVDEYEKTVVSLPGGGRDQDRFSQTPTRRRHWYYTGALTGLGASQHMFCPPNLKQQSFLSDLSSTEQREIQRALKGRVAREELFGDDGSERANIPYLVTESTYNVVCVQRPVDEKGLRGVYQVQPRESLESCYERDRKNPRQKHELTLATNNFGDVLHSITVAYANPTSSPDSDAAENAEGSIVVYKEIQYTDAIDLPGDHFYKPVPATTRDYRLYGFVPVSTFLDYEAMRNDNCGLLQKMPQIFPLGEIPYPSRQFKTLIKEQRHYYRSGNLQERLPLGKAEAPVGLDQSFELAFTKDLLQSAYKSNQTISMALMLETLEKAGYVQLENDTAQWWKPSSRLRFALENSNELKVARQNFYLPTISTDAFGHISRVTLDQWCLMPLTATDAAGNVIQATNNYIHMAVAKIIDINGNSQAIAYDSFGRMTAKSYSGKVEEQGDSMQNIPPCSPSQIEAFFDNPSESEALRILGTATERYIEDSHRFVRSQARGVIEPRVRAAIRRLVHSNTICNEQQPTLAISFDWIDPSGAILQTAAFTGHEWRFSGLEQHDGSVVVRKYHPFLKSQPTWQAVEDQSATFHFHDALKRKIATLNPDHTWSKLLIDAWTHHAHDESDTLSVSDPTSDPDVGGFFRSIDAKLYIPSYEQLCFANGRQTAVSQSKKYMNSPTIVHLDALGRDIMTVRDSGRLKQTERHIFDHWGNVQSTIDAMGRTVEKVQHNHLGQPLYRHRVDNGEVWMVPDIMNKSVLQWNSRQIISRVVYDSLRRPLEKWVRVTHSGSEVLSEKIEYGEQPQHVDQAYAKNQRGQVVVTHGQFGVRINEAFDFRGNLTRSSIRFAVEYAAELDWQRPVPLEPEFFTTLAQYDTQNRKISSQNANGNQTCHVYTPHGLLRSVMWKRDKVQVEWDHFISNITYNSFGNRTIIDYGNGCHTENTYEPLSQRLVRKRTTRGRGSVLEDIHYEHDCFHRIIQEDDESQSATFLWNNRVTAVKQYSYDGLGRLVQSSGREQINQQNGQGRGMKPYTACTGPTTHKGFPGTGDQLCRYVERYEYDLANNILALAHQTSSDGSVSGWTRQYTYEDTSNRLINTSVGKPPERYAYDGDAGLMGLVSSMPGFTSITWDHSDRMSTTSRQLQNSGRPETTWFIYDENGHRLRKVTQRADDGTGERKKLRETLYLESYTRYQTYAGDGKALNLEKDTAHVTGMNILALIEKDRSNSQSIPLVRYQLSNNLEVSDDASIISYQEHSAFGAVMYSACGKQIEAPSAYRYAAYERDPETSLDYCEARYYAWWIGRWISPDPSGLVDGLNLFAYVRNDPINFFDPSGRSGFPTIGQYVVWNAQRAYNQRNPMNTVHSATQGMEQQQKQSNWLRNASQGIENMNNLRATANQMADQIQGVKQNVISAHHSLTQSTLSASLKTYDVALSAGTQTYDMVSSAGMQTYDMALSAGKTAYDMASKPRLGEYSALDITASMIVDFYVGKAIGHALPFVMPPIHSQSLFAQPIPILNASFSGMMVTHGIENLADKPIDRLFKSVGLKKASPLDLAKAAWNGSPSGSNAKSAGGGQMNSTTPP